MTLELALILITLDDEANVLDQEVQFQLQDLGAAEIANKLPEDHAQFVTHSAFSLANLVDEVQID